MGEGFLTSDAIIYLTAILALLGLWLFHQMQVRSGRIQAVDVFDRSVVRMYIYVTCTEGPTCDVCANAHGRVFQSSRVGKKGFSPLEGKCTGAVPCQGFLVGLYGGWLEAREIVARLQRSSKHTILRLSPAELYATVKGQWKQSVSADTDRVSVHLLEAICFEKSDADVAIEAYRYVIDQAKETRHLPFVVPAYLRLIALLLRVGREEEARHAIERCESRFPAAQCDPHAPSTEQRKALEEKKSLLWKRQSLQVTA
ncbi:MAG: tetratricopeptide repeat protein [Nitrospira sp.]